jgi:hypothetical protein
MAATMAMAVLALVSLFDGPVSRKVSPMKVHDQVYIGGFCLSLDVISWKIGGERPRC